MVRPGAIDGRGLLGPSAKYGLNRLIIWHCLARAALPFRQIRLHLLAEIRQVLGQHRRFLRGYGDDCCDAECGTKEKMSW